MDATPPAIIAPYRVASSSFDSLPVVEIRANGDLLIRYCGDEAETVIGHATPWPGVLAFDLVASVSERARGQVLAVIKAAQSGSDYARCIER